MYLCCSSSTAEPLSASSSALRDLSAVSFTLVDISFSEAESSYIAAACRIVPSARMSEPLAEAEASEFTLSEVMLIFEMISFI